MAHPIEPARGQDLEQCATLLGHLFAQEAEFRPDPAIQLQGLRRILADQQAGPTL